MISINGVSILAHRSHDTHKRIANIRRVHEANPEYTRKELVSFVPETKYMVETYWNSPNRRKPV